MVTIISGVPIARVVVVKHSLPRRRFEKKTCGEIGLHCASLRHDNII